MIKKRRLLTLGPDATMPVDAPRTNPAPRPRPHQLPAAPRAGAWEGWLA